MSMGDPFGTAELRAGVVAAWRDSPTRLREDAATEADLVRAGYRDRVLTELAQNAADAAAKAGVPGFVAVWLDGHTLHIANTGVGLDVSGVHALTALRASAKGAGDAAVGQFGVGFTAVLSVSDEVEFRSASGSVRFSREETWAALRAEGIKIPEGVEDFRPPALRLAWPLDAAPASGFDSEIVLTLRAEVDSAALLAGMRAEAVDLLLELPVLQRIRIGADELVSTVRDLGAEDIHGAAATDRTDALDAALAALPDPDLGAVSALMDPDSGATSTPAGADLGAAPGLAGADLGAAPGLAGADSTTPAARTASTAEGDSGVVQLDLLSMGEDETDTPRSSASRVAEPEQPTTAGGLGGRHLPDAAAPGARGSFAGTGTPGLQELRITGDEAGEQIWWQYRTGRARWLVPVRDGRAVAARPDVLRAPTRSDEELSLPAILIADVPMQPDRRRLLPGARVAELASGYAEFARALPIRDRLVLVPAPGFARSEVDGLLREALVAELRAGEWLPVVGGAAAPGASSRLPGEPVLADEMVRADDVVRMGETARADDVVRVGETVRADDVVLAGDAERAGAAAQRPPSRPAAGTAGDGGHAATSAVPVAAESAVWSAAPGRVSVFTGVTVELAPLLAELVGPLVIPELSGRALADALAVLDVHRIGLARIAELSGSLEREPQWWYSLYDALDSFVTDPLAVEELGALAVPLTDGRTVTGPRTTVLDDHLESAIPVHWARLVHPEAAHELLGRLGARPATSADLLNDPALQAHLEDDPADPDTVDSVLALAAHADAAPGELPSWLGLIELPDETGELLPADELLLPGAPLSRVLVADSPFGTIAADAVERYGAQALRAVGVGWGFTLVGEEDPTGPDHHLDDEESWWDSLAEDPPHLLAVRDLDLVDDAEWPEALRLLLSEETTRPLLADRDGYTAWWLRHHAHIDGITLGLMRHPEDRLWAGLLPQLPGFAEPDLTVLRGVLAAPQELNAQLAEELLDALADPAKIPGPEAISLTYQLLAETVAAGRLDVEDVVLPDKVRAISGAVIDAADALVLDEAHFGPALPAGRLVVGDIDSAHDLADLLNLPVVSQAVTAEVVGAGRETTWAADPLGVLLGLQFGSSTRTGDLVVHDDLRVRLSGAYEGTVAVSWWEDGDVTHVQAQPRLV
ncbi:sacsin N-terminal ATP-binding-like domain-containing protein [Nocardia acididurans]|uniref:sacsin N-terminal ATP-binding-like domain-containing protein n=1 Tax=Nocardia acididurans TaxID=2802282 RepID=UPI001E29B768|nr:hypothetical protein [Nocardia acididurans]